MNWESWLSGALLLLILAAAFLFVAIGIDVLK